MSSYFYLQAAENASNAAFLNSLKNCAEEKKELIYVLGRPLTDQKYSYDYEDALIVLSPKRKIAVINSCGNPKEFDRFVDDVVEDVGIISDKYLYRQIIGRPREWREALLTPIKSLPDPDNVDEFFQCLKIEDGTKRKHVELLISLFIGSINDVDRVKSGVPDTTLDKVKQKIQLFDGDQTRFIYEPPRNKRITIQGLSGTGKTELLLHKLKDLYITESDSTIFFTCHNKILADSLRKRIPSFFNFMKVEQQIEWEQRLWCTNAWGATQNPDSGAYRRICSEYSLPFHRYSPMMTFSRVCELAIGNLMEMYGSDEIPPVFTYMLIDESQDFDENFFRLCEMVTEKHVYIAGDIFQSIFDSIISPTIEPDFLLGKCYRTDPKTLMFAHGLGMGLFENEKIRWLDEQELKDCGYKVQKNENESLILSREPIRRFEDLPDNFKSIHIVDATESTVDTVINLISRIKENNPTVLPDDIGIIMLDQSKNIYALADMLEIRILETFDWKVNKAYQTKEKQPETILISNRNNVKGLEFPFVVCITSSIKNNLSYRNALYTMLTRSFIETFLVIPEKLGSGLTDEMKVALDEINDKNQMTIKEPSDLEKLEIITKFEYARDARSHSEVMSYIFNQLEIRDTKTQEKLFALTKTLDLQESDEETLMQFVEDNMKFIRSK